MDLSAMARRGARASAVPALTAVALLWAVACGGPATGSHADDISGVVRGTVTAVYILDATAQDRGVVATLRVEGPAAEDVVADKADVSVTTDTRFYRLVDGKRAALEPDLATIKGTRVEVELVGPVAESYPVQATAGTVTILQ